MNKPYEKPSVKMVPLRSNESVAKVCWGNHGPATQRYWDTEGVGYVSFYCSGSSCGLTEQNLVVEYYEGKGDKEPDKVEPGTALHTKVYEKLIASGGDTGNSFHGEEQFPDNPGGMS